MIGQRAVLERLRHRGLHDGLLGGSRPWLVVGVAVWSLRALQWAVARDTEVVYRGRLEEGETLVIDARRPPARRDRRRERRASRRVPRRTSAEAT